mgnify:CR=1 FL=1
MPSPKNIKHVDELSDKLGRAKGVYLTDYIGLNVQDITDLRREFYANDVEYMVDPVFGLHVPVQCSNVDEKLLTPRELWKDKHKYDENAERLACKFENNFRKYQGEVSVDISLSGPQV